MKEFSITITAEDVKRAGDFTIPGQCLLATALKSRGIMEKPSVGRHDVFDLDARVLYNMEPIGDCNCLHWDPDTQTYGNEVIGKTFTFTQRTYHE